MLKCPPGQYFIEIATDMKLCPSIELGLGQDIIVSYVNVSPRQYFIEIATDMKLCPSIELGLGQDIIVSYVKVSPRTIFYRDYDMK
jgi:hypothetical protein